MFHTYIVVDLVNKTITNDFCWQSFEAVFSCFSLVIQKSFVSYSFKNIPSDVIIHS